MGVKFVRIDKDFQSRFKDAWGQIVVEEKPDCVRLCALPASSDYEIDHDLKLSHLFSDAVICGKKKAEIRKADRHFEVDQHVRMRVVDDDFEDTGDCILVQITHVVDDPLYVPTGCVVFSFDVVVYWGGAGVVPF